MYPEECFERVSEEDIQERWKRVDEWWRKDESLGDKERIGWKCKECGWSYFVRVLEMEDFEFEGEFGTAKSSLS